jgi:hypothetical protein
VYLSPVTNLEHISSKDDSFANRQMLKQFRSTKNFGQVTNLYDVKPPYPLSSDSDVFIDTTLFLKRDVLPMSLGWFNSRVPQGRVIVQTDFTIEGCPMEEQTVGSVMVIHMDRYDRPMGWLLNVYAIDSVYQPMNLCLVMQSREFHFRFRKAFVGFFQSSRTAKKTIWSRFLALCARLCTG